VLLHILVLMRGRDLFCMKVVQQDLLPYKNRYPDGIVVSQTGCK
jgi:hypothetical protein